jgi:hypothetical protein
VTPEESRAEARRRVEAKLIDTYGEAGRQFMTDPDAEVQADIERRIAAELARMQAAPEPVTVRLEAVVERADDADEHITMARLKAAMRDRVRRVFEFIRREEVYERGCRPLREALGVNKNTAGTVWGVLVEAGVVKRRGGGQRRTATYTYLPAFDRARALKVFEADKAAHMERFKEMSARFTRRAAHGRQEEEERRC